MPQSVELIHRRCNYRVGELSAQRFEARTVKRMLIEWGTSINGAIVDVESTHFDPAEGELITAGFLSKEGFTILQRVESSEADFKAYVAKIIEGFGRPLYAFKKDCEEGFCNVAVDHDLQMRKEASFVALRDEGLLDHYNLLCDPLFGEEIPVYWTAWKKMRNPLFLSKIIRHNYCCLAKEYYLKLKRIDGIDPKQIRTFVSSAAIEKKYVWPTLSVNLV